MTTVLGPQPPAVPDDELQALIDADSLDRLPPEALIASIKALAEELRDVRRRAREFEVYAWIGEDEFGSGVVGLKQGVVPAGQIPLVSVSRQKLDQDYIRLQLERQVGRYGKPIRLVRLVLAEDVDVIEPVGGGG